MLPFCLVEMIVHLRVAPFLSNVLLTWRRTSSARTQPRGERIQYQKYISNCTGVISQNVFPWPFTMDFRGHETPKTIHLSVATAVPRTPSNSLETQPQPRTHTKAGTGRKPIQLGIRIVKSSTPPGTSRNRNPPTYENPGPKRKKRSTVDRRKIGSALRLTVDSFLARGIGERGSGGQTQSDRHDIPVSTVR